MLRKPTVRFVDEYSDLMSHYAPKKHQRRLMPFPVYHAVKLWFSKKF